MPRDNQLNVPSISLYVISQNRKKRVKMLELSNVSALAWNNTLADQEPIWPGEDTFAVQVCIDTGNHAVTLHVGAIFNPYYIYKRVSDQKTLPHHGEVRPPKALPP